MGRDWRGRGPGGRSGRQGPTTSRLANRGPPGLVIAVGPRTGASSPGTCLRLMLSWPLKVSRQVVKLYSKAFGCPPPLAYGPRW